MNALVASPTVPDGQALRRVDDDGVALVTLCRPASRNSLSHAMLEEFSMLLAAIRADDRVRVVILAAEGPVFCAGHDLREMTAHRADPDDGRGFFTALWKHSNATMQAIASLPQPVIACVQGAAAAAGCQLVASCDLAVASEMARFSTPGVGIGLFCATPMVPLARNVGRKHALEMLLTGDAMTAANALRIGLVNRVVPAGEEFAEAMRLARRITSRSPSAIKLGKQAFYAGIGLPQNEAYDQACRIMVENMLNAEAREGIDAFLAKRPPSWET